MMKNIKFPYAPAIAWGLFIFALSVWPGKDFPKLPDWSDLLSVDKMVHITFYGVLTWLILWGKQKKMLEKPLNTDGTSRNNREGGVSLLFACLVAVFSSVFGWFLEWFQGAYCQDRMSDVMDGIANTIGAGIGLLTFLFYQKKLV